MMKVYEFDILSADGITKIDKFLNTFATIFTDLKFREYLAKKCEEKLLQICQQNLKVLQQGNGNVESNYMNSMHTEITDEYIYLYNDSVIDIANKKFMSEEAKQNYEEKLSLAKIVEFGVGVLGTNDETWQTNINEEEHIEKYGENGWFYYDDNGELHWTYGSEGKLIFNKLVIEIKENISSWLNEYLTNNLKG